MPLAQSRAICDFSNPHFRSKIPLYVLESAVSLPSREASGSANALRRPGIRANHCSLSPEERRCRCVRTQMSACEDIADHGAHSIHPPYGDKWRDMKSLCMRMDNHDANAAWLPGKALSGEIIEANHATRRRGEQWSRLLSANASCLGRAWRSLLLD
jgi:hypothetical protein